MAGELNVGTLTGTVEIEDHASPALDKLVNKVDILGQQLGGTTDQVLKNAAAFFTAEGAYEAVSEVVHKLTDEIETLTYQGAKVAEVEGSFDRLTAGAGRLGSTLLNELQQGTHSTITNFELMQTANRDLTAGMNLTDAQFKTLATGAYALARATGTDVKSAMDTMNDAMLTGRVRALSMLTGKIDLVAAEEKFAASLGSTADHLSAEGKIEAAREAILNAVGAATARLGAQTEGLDQKVDQARTSWHNFEEDLGKTIATNPELLQAWDSVGRAITEAFGEDKDALIKEISDDVGTAASIMADFARAGITVVKFISEFRGELEPILIGLGAYVGLVETARFGTAAFGLALKVAAGAAAAFSETLGLVSIEEEGVADAADSAKVAAEGAKAGAEAMATGLKTTASSARILSTSLGLVAFEAGLVYAAFELGKWQPISDFFEKLGLRTFGHMTSAEADARIAFEHQAEAAHKASESVKDHVEKLNLDEEAAKAAADEEARHAEFLQKSKSEMDEAAKAAAKLAEIDKEIAAVGKDWTTTLKEINPELVKNIEHLDKNGISMGDLKIKYHLTDAEVNALTKDMEAQQKVLDEATKKQKEHTDALAKLASLSQDYEKTAAHVPDVLKLQVEQYLKLGASTKDIADALNDKLTPAQVEAVKHQMDAVNSTHAQATAQSDLIDSLGKTTHALIAEAEAADKANKSLGNSLEVNAGNLGERLSDIHLSNGGTLSGIGDATALAKKGYSFSEIVAYLEGGPLSPTPIGPKIPGFKNGGIGDFGDGTLAVLHGREMVAPLDKMSMGNTYNTFYVNGSAEDVAQGVANILIRDAKNARPYGSAV